jgi:hypothetical protein
MGFFKITCLQGAISIMYAALERKHRSEVMLELYGVKQVPDIPPIESEAEAQLRTPREAAKRAFLLYALLGMIFYHKPEEITYWVQREGLWEDLSPREKEVFSIPISALAQEEKAWKLRALQSNVLTWRMEALWILLWCLGKLDHLDWPEEQCNGSLIRGLLPNPGEPVGPFLENARFRPLAEILDALDLHYRIHLMLEDERCKFDEALFKLDPMIVYERIHALAWLAGWQDEWDD